MDSALPSDVDQIICDPTASEAAVPDLSNGSTEDQLNRQPGGAGAWGILPCVEHVTMTNRACTGAMQLFLREPEPAVKGKAPALSAIIPAAILGRAEVVAAFESSHDAIRDIAVAAMSPQEKRHLVTGPQRTCRPVTRYLQMTGRILFLMGVFLLPAMPQNTRAAFLKMIDRPRVPLSPEVVPQVARGGTEQVHFSYAADATQRVPGLMLRPAENAAKLPVIIVLHGTGGNKEGQLPLLRQLAGKGFLAIAIDGRYHGERSTQGTGSADYQAAMLRAWSAPASTTAAEHPFLYDTVWDVMRLIDYVETLPGADASRIGLIGFSKGGMETYLAAAVDPRIRVAVPCIGVQSFRWALDNDSWQSRAGTFQTALDAAAKMDAAAKQNGVPVADAVFLRHFYDKVAPGVYSDFDGPAMLPLIAPRALLTINGETDARTPGPGLQECFATAKKAYAAHPERFEQVIEPKTGHAVTPAAQATAIAWFEKWLRL